MKENDNAPNQCGVPSPISVNCPGQHTTTMCNSVINTTFPKRIDIAFQLIMSVTIGFSVSSSFMLTLKKIQYST